ncbi:MAG: chorismate mutase [Victivallales bacterium]|nr:chorismate mutase [Victivallales bacterium]
MAGAYPKLSVPAIGKFSNGVSYVKMSMDIQTLRRKIDSLDHEVVKLLNERCSLAAQIGSWKRQHGQPFYVPEREKNLYDRLHGKNPGPLPQKALKAIYREIISAAISLEKPLRVIALSSYGTIEAAKETFGSSASFICGDNACGVVSGVARHKCDYGVLPLMTPTLNHRAVRALAEFPEVRICAKKIGSRGHAGVSYFIIGLQATRPCSVDQTAVLVSPSKGKSSLEALAGMIPETMLSRHAVVRGMKPQAIFIELNGHQSSEAVRTLINDISVRVGTCRLLGAYPVFSE